MGFEIDQDAPDDYDHWLDAAYDYRERAWENWLLEFPELTDQEKDLARWAFDVAWSSGSRFEKEYRK